MYHMDVYLGTRTGISEFSGIFWGCPPCVDSFELKGKIRLSNVKS